MGTSVALRHPLIQGNRDKKEMMSVIHHCFVDAGERPVPLFAATHTEQRPPLRFEMCVLFHFLFYFQLALGSEPTNTTQP